MGYWDRFMAGPWAGHHSSEPRNSPALALPPAFLSSATPTCIRERPKALLGWPHLGSQESPGYVDLSHGDYSEQEREGSPGWLVWQSWPRRTSLGGDRVAIWAGGVSETRLWQRGPRILGSP